MKNYRTWWRDWKKSAGAIWHPVFDVAATSFLRHSRIDIFGDDILSFRKGIDLENIDCMIEQWEAIRQGLA